ncbi:MAG: DUF4157 domain-containing protein [Anaerolineales bacterium]|nr:DUF4157 domain-containing protein [Anaerolineales bacterium]
MINRYKTEATPKTQLSLLRQVDEQTAGQTVRLSQYDPLAQMTHHPSNGANAEARAATLTRVTAGRPARAGQALLQLQRQYGNHYVQRVVTLSRKASGEAEIHPVVEQNIQQARGGGQALDSDVRGQMESTFGADFTGVRIHTGTQADTLNQSLNAKAFTTGRDIFFREGQYSPASSSGRELLAHELTHVVQQGSGQVQPKLTLGQPGDRYEREADAVARAIIQHEQRPAPVEAHRGAIHRQTTPEEEETSVQAKVDQHLAQRQAEEEKEEETPIQAKGEAAGIRRQTEEEEEPVQTKATAGQIQRQAEEEKEVETPVQAKGEAAGLQRQAEEEEEPVQTKVNTMGLQRQAEEEEKEPVQAKAESSWIQCRTDTVSANVGLVPEVLPPGLIGAPAPPNTLPASPLIPAPMTVVPSAPQTPVAEARKRSLAVTSAAKDEQTAPGSTAVEPQFGQVTPLAKSVGMPSAPPSVEVTLTSTSTTVAAEPAEATAPAPEAEKAGETPVKTDLEATKEGVVEAEKPTAAPAPESDPRFQGVMARLETTARKEKRHAPAARKVAEAKAAVRPPANDRRSRAQAQQVEVMDRQEAKKPDKNDFLTMLRQQLKAIAPSNMEDTENFKKEGKAGQLKASLTGQVRKQKEASERDIKTATATEPDPNRVPQKEVVDMPREPGDKSPANLHSKEILPLPKAESEISVESNNKKAEQLMAENDIDEEQLEKANEPQFSEALTAKKDLEKHVKQVPKAYQAEEGAFLKTAQAEVAAEERSAKKAMRARRTRAKGAVKGRQLEAQKKEEEARKKVADDIQGMYQTTKKKVEKKLNSLDRDVNTIFDNGERQARNHFETYVALRMLIYKRQRYSGVSGAARWIGDKLTGLPDEVNRFYREGKEQYIAEMDAVLVRIAAVVESRLKEAKDEIAKGRQKIEEYVEGLDRRLRKSGQEALRNVSSRFEALNEGVEAKKGDLAQKMVKRYKEARNKLDERIKQLQEENKGLLSDFIAKIKGIIKIFRDFKNRMAKLLAKSGNVLRQIIKDPIGFLKNLLGAVKLGFNQFSKNIALHLKRGLISWLFGTMSEAGIEIPTEFSPKAIMGLILQILGITKERIRAKVVKHIGAKNVERLEKAWSVISTLISEGPAGLWQQLKQYIGNLKDRIVEEVKQWLITQIIKQAILFVVSMFNPVSALLKAIQMIYNVIMFFIENIERILRLVEAVIASTVKIVVGDIAGAATWIENAMGRMVPIIIAFLARLLNLSGISQKVRSIIKRIRKPVDKAIDKVLVKIVSKVKGVFGKGKALVGKAKAGAKKVVAKGKEAVAGIIQWWKAKKKFKAKDGTTHVLFFTGSGKKAILMVASEKKTPYEIFLKWVAEGHLNTEYNADFKKAEGLAGKIDMLKAEPLPKGLPDVEKEKKIKEKTKKMEELLEKLRELTARLFGFGQVLPERIEPHYEGKNSAGFGKWIKAKALTRNDSKFGSRPTQARHPTYDVLNKRRERSGASYYVRGHLLSEKLGGEGKWENMTPLSRRGNKDHEAEFESIVKAAVNAGAIMEYRVDPVYAPRGDKDSLKDEVDKGHSPSNAAEIKAIIDKEDHVPLGLTCEAHILKRVGERVGSPKKWSVINTVDRTAAEYHLSGSTKFEPVDINSGDEAELKRLPGIKPNQVQNIRDAIKKRGRPFGNYKVLAREVQLPQLDKWRERGEIVLRR